MKTTPIILFVTISALANVHCATQRIAILPIPRHITAISIAHPAKGAETIVRPWRSHDDISCRRACAQINTVQRTAFATVYTTGLRHSRGLQGALTSPLYAPRAPFHSYFPPQRSAHRTTVALPASRPPFSTPQCLFPPVEQARADLVARRNKGPLLKARVAPV